MPSAHSNDNPRRGEEPEPRLHGDEHRLFATYAIRLRRTLGGIVRTSDANLDDACSFAWLQVLAKDPRRDTLYPWLLKIAIREAWRLDREARSLGTIDEGPEIASASSDPIEVYLLVAETAQALPEISERRRRMLLLHAIGLTMKEIGEAEGISAARARELVYRARLQLRAATGRDDDGRDWRR